MRYAHKNLNRFKASKIMFMNIEKMVFSLVRIVKKLKEYPSIRKHIKVFIRRRGLPAQFVKRASLERISLKFIWLDILR